MKRRSLATLLGTLLIGSCPATLSAQETIDVDRTKYPDYTEAVNPDWSLMTPTRRTGEVARTTTQRPDHVNNAETRHFPPVFNQDGGSCGSASRISYMFSYELAAYRNLDGSLPANHYPSHFVHLHANSPSSPINQDKNAFVMKVGVPSAATYGGQTYSSLFGSQSEGDSGFGWMQGYDKWYEAMHNRMFKPANFPLSVGTEEGREAVKNWLWNHNGDDSFAAGGICGIGVASNGDWQPIPSTEKNEKLGVAGMKYVKAWGTQVDHALTIVGYDDRIEFDLDDDGIYGEKDADELGAWIIANSWGPWWCNGGFIYCPYAHGVSQFKADGSVPNSFWMPEIYHVRKDYRPLRTIKLEMDYSHRSEIALSAGVSADLTAEKPEKTIPFVHFSYAGDGSGGNSNPAPEVPMLGRWADGKLHTEPMEFGYDLTELSEGFDMSQPLKYFFIVNSRTWAQGKGNIYQASIIDYSLDELGIETPFAIGRSVEIKNAGEQTIITVIVQGNNEYHKPQNVTYANGTLSWQAPQQSNTDVNGYKIYLNGSCVATVKGNVLSYKPESTPTMGEYGVSAVYADGEESVRTVACIPLNILEENVGVHYNHAGFTIPDVMTPHYENATIEFWIKPSSISYWNQSAGPGWGTFCFYVDGYSRYYAGWEDNDENRAITYNAPMTANQWHHVAIVVQKNQVSLYFNGTRLGNCTSKKHSGVGGFGDLVFASTNSAYANWSQHGVYDEVRIWNFARTQDEIKASMYTEFTGSVMPQGLITYLRGDTFIDEEGNTRLFDCAGGHHATLQGSYNLVNTNELGLTTSSEEPTLSINVPQTTLYAGIPVTLGATYNTAVNHIVWTAEGANIKELATANPVITFATAGTHTVSAVGYTADGRTAKATHTITVEKAPKVEAAFTATAYYEVPAGKRISFHAQNPQAGYTYRWEMPGADKATATGNSAAASYQKPGYYEVTLTVTAPDGTQKSHTTTIEVIEVAPKAAFSISPAVVLKGESVRLKDESLYAPLYRQWTLVSERDNYLVYADAQRITIDQPGVYDVTLSVSNNSGLDKTKRERGLIVVNADSKNGLLFSNEKAMVTAKQVPFTEGQKDWSIDWWMNAEWPANNTNSIGDNEKTMLIRTLSGGKMQLIIGGQSVGTLDDYIIPGEWHHYAITFNGSEAIFYRDGKQYTTATLSGVLPKLESFHIGSNEAPFRGSIDEFRVWGTTLTEAKLQGYANAPIENIAKAEADDKLVLYYNFNQSGGDVQDATTKANHGVRTNFGPDGDAWGLSKGVFCLNFNKTTSKDITDDMLINYMCSFKGTSTCVNPTSASRFYALKSWTVRNTITEGSITTGAHVDRDKGHSFTVTTGWDGFASTLSDHSVFQTITLPQGAYTFTAWYNENYEGQCGSSYIVAAEGILLPTTENLDKAIAYSAMKPYKEGTVNSNAVKFLLEQETMVSLGLLVNMSGGQCMALKEFTLTWSQPTTFGTTQEIPDGIREITTEGMVPKGVYDLMGRLLRRDSQQLNGLAPGIYIIDGCKTVVK